MTSQQLIRLVSYDYFSVYVESFLDDCKAALLSPRTIEFYRGHLERYQWWCREHGVSMDPNEHNQHNIRDFFNYLSTASERWGGGHTMSVKEITPKTYDAYRRALNRWYSWLVDQEYIESSPMAKVRKPRIREEQPEPFSREDLEKIGAALHRAGDDALAARDRAIVAILLDVGLRVSELCAIQMEDIHMATGDILIKRGKGNKPRSVRLGARARKVVRNYMLRYRRVVGESGPLFLTMHQEPLKPTTVRMLMEKLEKRSGVVHVHPHRFRHTMAISALRAGMSLFHLQAILGHTTLDMVRKYAKIAEEDIQEASKHHSPFDHMKLNL